MENNKLFTAKGILSAVGCFILYFALTMLFQTLFSILFMAIAAANGLRDEKLITEYANSNILGITIFSGILTILVFYGICRIKKNNVKTEWKLKHFEFKDIILPITMSFSYSLLFALMTYNISIENSIMISNSVKFYSEISPVLGILMMAINLLLIAPASEELVFRGIIYTRVEKASNPIVAITISSLLFGGMHIFAGGGILAIGSILMGAVFGYIFYKYDSLWVCIITHAVANLPDFILFNHNDISNSLLFGLKMLFVIMFVISFILIQKKKILDK